MRKRIIITGIVGFLFFSCMQPKYTSTNTTKKYTFALLVIDIDGNRIENAQIDFKATQNNVRLVNDSIGFTDSLGKFFIKVPATPSALSIYETSSNQMISFSYNVSKEGYYDRHGEMTELDDMYVHSLTNVNMENVTLIKRMKYTFALLVIDIDGNRIENAEIDFKATHNNDRLVNDSIGFTDSLGKFFIEVPATQLALSIYETSSNQMTSFSYNVSKEGYYDRHGEMTIPDVMYVRDSEISMENVTLIKPIDYFNEKFAATDFWVGLKKKILSFIDILLLQSLLSDSKLETKSINIVEFKEKNYLQLRFIHTNIYNSLKLNKYDIGGKIFDEVIRKMLTPIDTYISLSNNFYGCDIIVTGYTKSFVNEYENPRAVEYRFLMGQELIKKYKDKAVAGQDVLDSSIILMDDERIKLNLQ